MKSKPSQKGRSNRSDCVFKRMTSQTSVGNADDKMTEVPLESSMSLEDETTETMSPPAHPSMPVLQIDKSMASVDAVNENDQSGSQKVFKKTSPNSMFTLYLPTRDLVMCNGKVDPLRGVLHVDRDFVKGQRIFGQLTLTFRYGREDEEVMGLRFCNEAVMCLTQIYPQISDNHEEDRLTPLQDALMKRLGDLALPFSVEINPQAPPSVQLVPAKRYYGASIGTSYDVRCYIADRSDERLYRRSMVRMSVRVLQKTDLNAVTAGPPENSATLGNNRSTTTTPAMTSHSSSCDSAPQTPGPFGAEVTGSPRSLFAFAKQTSSGNLGGGEPMKSKAERVDSFSKLKLSPKTFRFTGKLCRSKSEIERDSPDTSYALNQNIELDPTASGPQGAVDKPFLLQDGRVGLRASLDRSIYGHDEEVTVTVHIRNDSRKTVRRIRVFAIQHVDVCMFNNGKFKNVVADIDQGDHSVRPGESHQTTYKLVPKRGQTKNWIALEDSMQRCNDPDEIKSNIASSAVRTPNTFFDDKNVFAIYVSYYVKVKLTLSGMGGELSLKLPFTLAHFDDGLDCKGSVPSPIDSSQNKQLQPVQSRDDSDSLARGTDPTNTTTNETTKNKSIIMENSTSFSSSSKMTCRRTTMTAKGQISCETNDKHPRGSSPEGQQKINLSVLRQRRFSQARQERIRPVEDSSLDRIETLSDDGEVPEFRTEALVNEIGNDSERWIEFQANSETMEQEQHEKRSLLESSSPVVMVVVGSCSADVNQEGTRFVHSTGAEAGENERKPGKDTEVSTSCTTLAQVHAPQS